MVKRTESSPPPTRREREVEEALEEGNRRGEGEDAVAKRLGIKVSTLRWWASQIRCRAARRQGAGPGSPTALAAPAFIEVHVESRRPALGFEVVIENGREVRVPLGFDAGELVRLVQVLERSC